MKKPGWSRIGLLIAGAALVCLVSAVPAVEGDTAEADEAALERARGAADALAGELMKALMHELEAGGPPGAVKVCSERAQEIAASHSGDGLSIRRVSLKVRNPADEPDDYERGKLVELEALEPGTELPREIFDTVVEEDTRRLRYLRILKIRKPCLACHGSKEEIDPEVRRLLQEHYPDDRATGYREGDLRGAVSVIVTLD
jgi:hypothetical protein